MSSDALAIAWYLHRSAPELLRHRVSWPRGVRAATPPGYADRVPTRELSTLLEGLERAGGSTLAARAGVEAGGDPRTALALLMRASASVGEALDHAVTYWRVLSSSRLERRTLASSVELVIVDEWRDRQRGHDHYVTYLVGLLVGTLRQAGVMPSAIALPGTGPGSLNGSSFGVFGVHASSGADLGRVRISTSDLSAASVGADPAVAGFLRGHLGETLEQLQMAITWQVDELINEHLADGLGMRGAAKMLGLSERTLRRRLDDEGTSFRERLDHVRRSRSLELLAHEEVGRVAQTLGFVDARSFQRAFRRWTRMTPLAYKRSLGAARAHA